MKKKKSVCIPLSGNANRVLQKKAVSGPFMRQFIASTLVARRAGKNQIPGVVGTPFPGDWDNVVNVVGILAIGKRLFAPIASAFLRLVLAPNIISRISAAYTLFACLAYPRVSLDLRFAVFGLTVPLPLCSKLIGVSKPPLFFQFSDPYAVCCPPCILCFSKMCSMSPVVVLHSQGGLLLMCVSILLAALILTILAHIRQLVCGCGVPVEKFFCERFLDFTRLADYKIGANIRCRGSSFDSIHLLITPPAILIQTIFGSRPKPKEILICGKNLLATRTTLMSFRHRGILAILPGQAPAFFAEIAQAIFVAFACDKKLFSCGVKIVALVALFSGNLDRIIHDLNHLCLATLSFAVAKMVRCSILSRGLITPSLGNIFIVPTFFLLRQKVERR